MKMNKNTKIRNAAILLLCALGLSSFVILQEESNPIPEDNSVFKHRTHGYYFHLIRFWTYNWSKELMDRRVSLSRSIINGFDSLYKDSKKVKKISEDSGIGVKEKVKLIKDILPGEPLSYIADALNISLSTLKRRIK